MQLKLFRYVYRDTRTGVYMSKEQYDQTDPAFTIRHKIWFWKK